MPGWTLDHVNCDTSGISFSEFENGVTLNCLTEGGSGECDFVNVPAQITNNIPTLSEWGMLAAAGGLMLVGVFFAVRRRKAQTV